MNVDSCHHFVASFIYEPSCRAANTCISYPRLQICAIFSATITIEIRDPLRIVVLKKRWEPARIPTPRFINAWTCKESEGSQNMVPVLLDSHCENAVVWRPGDLDSSKRRVLFVENGEMSFSRVYAKSGTMRETTISRRCESTLSGDDKDKKIQGYGGDRYDEKNVAKKLKLPCVKFTSILR